MKDFFISYNRADKGWAEWIAWQLEDASYSTVIQAWDFRPGSNFVLEMQKAATEAQRTIAVLSPDYLKALFTQPEWAAAFAHDPTGEKRTLLTVRVRECELKGLLAQIVYVDLVGLDETAARDALLAGVQTERAKPKTAPVFPLPKAATSAKPPRFPGALPPIWNVPHHRNRYFTGREQLLQSLYNALTAKGTAALTQAIHGLGGVGKTQLAVEYAYRYANEYELIWWLRAEDNITLATDFAKLTTPLNLPLQETDDQSIRIEAMLNWFNQHTGWLLIFDNASSVEEVRRFLPQAATGHILVTSRLRHWQNLANTFGIKEWEQYEAINFICNRTRQNDIVNARNLAEEVGYLPLALAQAAAYITAAEISLLDYLQRFKKLHLEILNRGKPETNYPHTVATTWELSFQQATKLEAWPKTHRFWAINF